MLWRDPDFLKLWCGQAVSRFGSGITATGLPLMAVLVLNRYLTEKVLAERKANGASVRDEVWDGVYVMSPLADNEHQQLGFDLAAAIKLGLVQDERVRIFPGCNVSDLSTKKSVRDAVSLAGSSNVVTRVPDASSTAPKIVSAASAAIFADAGI